jgi:hypothetical protein
LIEVKAAPCLGWSLELELTGKHFMSMFAGISNHCSKARRPQLVCKFPDHFQHSEASPQILEARSIMEKRLFA